MASVGMPSELQLHDHGGEPVVIYSHPGNAGPQRRSTNVRCMQRQSFPRKQAGNLVRREHDGIQKKRLSTTEKMAPE